MKASPRYFSKADCITGFRKTTVKNELGQKLFNFFENYRPPPLTKGNSFSNIGLP